MAVEGVTRVTKRIIIVSISAVVFLYDILQRLVLSLSGRKPAARCVVLYYHDIPREQGKNFARQMSLLHKFSQPLSCNARPSLGAGNCYVIITFDDGFISFKEIALPELEKRSIPATIFIPTQFIGNVPGWMANSSERLMTCDEIRIISKNPLVTIGSHGVSHRPFTGLMPEEVNQEFMESKRILESIVGQMVTSFSFPHGAYAEEHLQIAREVGYAMIYSIKPVCAFEKPDEHITGRVKVCPSDWPLEFVLKITGSYRWLPYAYRSKRNFNAVLTKRILEVLLYRTKQSQQNLGETNSGNARKIQSKS